MAKVPLRVYNREIEELIDRGQTEEALAHCKHILQLYPKYIEAYRLLGKTFLESQRYAEASDILQRVLSSVPDDFVSHVGMSIIREDEGNLDGAIWHMERAYEIQPSNVAVQDEVRRLYGRRDGSEPARVHMTRGGLVRMYARGDLPQQAITEIRATLAQDPQRPDLQVLLARTYVETGKRVEAAEVCSELISKFPYCFEANRILAEILPESKRVEEAAVYQQRIIALDPYMAFVSVDAPLPSDIPDTLVMVDRLDWDRARVESAQSEWTDSPGFTMEGKQENAHILPDWLASLSPLPSLATGNSALPSANPFTNERADVPAVPELGTLGKADEEPQEIPEWMKDAGWGAKNPLTTEQPPNLFDEELLDVAIPANNIPEWLRPMAPASPLEEDNPPGLSWIEEIAGINPPEEPEAQPEITLQASPTPPDFPSESILPVEESQPDMAPNINNDVPESANPEGPLPDWMEELKQFPNPEDSKESTSSESEPNKLDLPAWMNEDNSSSPFTAETPTIPVLEDRQATMDWLEELAAQHGSEAQTIIARRSNQLPTPPSWVHESELNNQVPVDEPSIEIPDWLQGLDSPVSSDGQPFQAESPDLPEGLGDQELPTPLDPTSGEDRLSEVPDWLGEQASVTNEIAKDDQPRPEINQPEEILPDWLVELSLEPVSISEEGTSDIDTEIPRASWSPSAEEAQSQSQWIPAAMGDQSPTTDLSDGTSDDWLQTLQQQFNPDQPREIPSDSIPDWLKGFEAEASPDLEASAAPNNDAEIVRSAWVTESSLSDGSIPESDELTTLSNELAEPAAEPAAVMPDWLAALEAPIPDPHPTSQDEAVAEMSEVSLDSGSVEAEAAYLPTSEFEPDQIPVDEALKEQADPIQERSPQDELAPTAPTDDLPDWLQDLDNATVAEDISELEPASVSEDLPIEPISDAILSSTALPLQELEAQVELPPADTTSEVVPVESPSDVVPEPLPDWLVGLRAEPSSDVVPTSQSTPQRGALDVSDWMKELEAQGFTPVTEPEPNIEPVISNIEWQPEPADVVEIQPTSDEDIIPAGPEPTLEIIDTETQIQPEITPEEQPVEVIAPALVQPVQLQTASVDPLSEAQSALAAGQIDSAVERYAQLIQSDQMVVESIHDLREALHHHPMDVNIWQTLGDGYLRHNQVQEALDAYTKAEELMR
jgi:tetratricopeptide (TPR) repeat protein